jgi:hypothetical protein
MRGTLAKELRRKVYGEGGSSRTRQWSSDERTVRWFPKVTDHLGAAIGSAFRRLWTGRVIADQQRRTYQHLKRNRRGMSWRQVSARLPVRIS